MKHPASWLAATVGLTLVLNAIDTVLAVQQGLAAGQGHAVASQQVASEWMTAGTAISAPLPLLILLAILGPTALRRDRWGTAAVILLIILGVVALVAILIEPSTLHPINRLEAIVQPIGLALSVIMIALGGLDLRGRWLAGR